MRALIPIAYLLCLAVSDLHAARCKVDGEWYPYDSPQCSPQRSADAINDGVESEKQPPQPQRSAEQQLIPPPYVQHAVADYRRPWKEVAPSALARCDVKGIVTRLHCRMAEEIGYWAMRGSFDLPESVVPDTKALCMEKSTSFEGQSHCMQDESRGYQRFWGEYEMPEGELSRARKKCIEQVKSYSLRGSCVKRAETAYKEKIFGKPPKRRVYARVAGGPRIPPPGFATDSGVTDFIVDPESVPAIRRAFEPPPPPAPMAVGQWSFHLGVMSKDFPTVEAFEDYLNANSTYFILSPDKPIEGSFAYLGFNKVEHLSPEHPAMLRADDDASVYVSIQVEKGKKYLVDFVIETWAAGSYTLSTRWGQNNIEDIGGTHNHIIARLEAKSSGRTNVSLRQNVGTGFRVHAVAVSSIQPDA